MNAARIVCNPKIMMGKPTVAGTRITVEYILEELSHGKSADALVSSHPTLTNEGIHAALDYVMKVLRLDVVDSVEADRDGADLSGRREHGEGDFRGPPWSRP